MAMINYAVYSTTLGSPTKRTVLRWGVCAEEDLTYQAGVDEAVVNSGNYYFPDNFEYTASITFYYNTTTQVFSSNQESAPPPASGDGYSESDLRLLRNTYLLETDYTQLLDVPISNSLRSSFAIYRQELRDLPSTPGWPLSVVWPTRPTYTKDTSHNPPEVLVGSI